MNLALGNAPKLVLSLSLKRCLQSKVPYINQNTIITIEDYISLARIDSKGGGG